MMHSLPLLPRFHAISHNIAFAALAFCTTLVSAQSSQAQTPLRITIENLAPADGFFFTPVWIGIHDGTFDVFSTNQLASDFPGVEPLAEMGDTGPLSARFHAMAMSGVDTTLTSPGGFAPLPVFDPGEQSTQILSVNAPATNRYLSFASMVIPSNDAFFSNGSPVAYELFDSAGNFRGPVTITVRGDNIYDSGTEANNGLGAAFSATGGTATDTLEAIAIHPGLDDFLGTNTAAGTTLTSSLANNAPLARITITAVPEPSTIATLSFTALLSSFVWRRFVTRR